MRGAGEGNKRKGGALPTLVPQPTPLPQCSEPIVVSYLSLFTISVGSSQRESANAEKQQHEEQNAINQHRIQSLGRRSASVVRASRSCTATDTQSGLCGTACSLDVAVQQCSGLLLQPCSAQRVEGCAEGPGRLHKLSVVLHPLDLRRG